MKFLYCAILLVLLSGGATANNSLSVGEVENHEAVWNSQNLSSVSYTLKEGMPFGYTEYKIHSVGEKCSAMSRSVFGKQKEEWQAVSCSSHTLSEQFRKVKAQLVAGVIKVEANFNSEFGYIENFSVEPKTEAFDQGWYIEVSGFKAVRAK